MSNIVIVGNALPAVHTANALRQKGHSGDIKIFCPEGVPPYDRQLLAKFLAKKIKESALFTDANALLKEHQIQALTHEGLGRLSLKRRQVVGVNKNQLGYDQLVLTDVGQVKLPTIKGHHKKGVFDALRFASVKEMAGFVPFIDQAIVQVTSFLGLNIACALSGHKKEVLIVTPEPILLNGYLDEESGTLLKQILEANGVRVIIGQNIEEVIGDGEVKAIRLSSGKIMAGQMVVFDRVATDVKLLTEAEIFTDDGILQADPIGRHQSHPEVFMGIELTGRFDLSVKEAVNEGARLASHVLDPQAAYQPDKGALREFGLSLVRGFCAGVTVLPEGGREYMSFDGPANIFKKIFVVDDCIVGGLSFNAPDFETKIVAAINNRQSIRGLEEAFLHEHV